MPGGRPPGSGNNKRTGVANAARRKQKLLRKADDEELEANQEEPTPPQASRRSIRARSALFRLRASLRSRVSSRTTARGVAAARRLSSGAACDLTLVPTT
eukprot:3618824-Prymnesium_polylepis.1